MGDEMKINLAILAGILTLSPLFSAHAEFEACRDLFPDRTPPKLAIARPLTRDLCLSEIAILHSGESKTPVYVVERLNRARLIDAQDEERTDRFYEEARLPIPHRARLADYRKSGFDRGHMAPAADMPTPEGMTQSFSLANMAPQAPALNRGIWAHEVEKPTRDYAMQAAGDVFVFTGPAFHDDPIQTIGAGRVWVPSHVWKMIYDASTREAWAFWIENRDDAGMSPLITYADLKRLTGLELLPASSGDATPTTIPALAPSEDECGDKSTCAQMTDCAEALHYLTRCGVRSLDRNGDGIPCESLCN